MKITAMQRPFLMTVMGVRFPLTSVEAQRIIDGSTLVERATAHRVIVSSEGQRAVIVPATWGGGPAFEVVK